MRTKPCPYCGHEIPLNEIKCRYCLKKIPKKDIRNQNFGIYDFNMKKLKSYPINQNLNINEKQTTKYSNVLPIRRWLALMIFTLGLYKYYWFYKNSKLIGERYPILRTIGFIIPIINWVMYYILLKDMKKVIKSANIKTFNIAFNFFLYFFVPILGFWSMVNVQENMNQYWRKTQCLKERVEFTTLEKAIIITLALIYILLFIIIILSIIMIFNLFC